jgi:hypothetical protein
MNLGRFTKKPLVPLPDAHAKNIQTLKINPELKWPYYPLSQLVLGVIQVSLNLLCLIKNYYGIPFTTTLNSIATDVKYIRYAVDYISPPAKNTDLFPVGTNADIKNCISNNAI